MRVHDRTTHIAPDDSQFHTHELLREFGEIGNGIDRVRAPVDGNDEKLPRACRRPRAGKQGVGHHRFAEVPFPLLFAPLCPGHELVKAPPSFEQLAMRGIRGLADINGER